MESMDKNSEIPDAFRDLAQQNVLRARSAYDQFMAAAREAQSLAAASGESMAASAKEIQARLMEFAEKNAEVGLAFAGELAGARDFNEWITTYQQHATRQSETYIQQAHELGRLISAAHASR